MKKNGTDSAWLKAALDYVPQWLGLQLERFRQPGCSVAIARGGEILAELALGVADMRTGKPLTPRHRLRIASHSKSFTATGVMLLREQGKIGLDDPIGRYVDGLHKDLARARIGELLSHAAGVTRDGPDAGQFLDRRAFLSRAELLADLRDKPPLDAGVQLKYSNHGYGLLGLMMEQVTGTEYASWMVRHVIDAAGLQETVPDMPRLARGAPMAVGHSSEFPFGQRLIVPGDNVCDAMAPAAGFVSTASDVARFFSQLAPDSKHSILSPASRREMAQRRWRDPCNVFESHYGLGTMLSAPGPREWMGHTGGLQGFLSRTARYPALDLTVTALTNAQDGLSTEWVDGIASILFAFQQHGAPAKKEAAWAGRWWSLWGATDLVPMGKLVCQVVPAMFVPFNAATTELAITGRDTGVVQKASAYASPGQAVRRVRDAHGVPTELWVGGSKFVPKDAMLAEATQRYRKSKTRPGRSATSA
ncbi:MAG: serine hydrolase [Burkholderiales bacterium RIFCSPHIGHO2_12_FULL_65_48]|nr:MAG: serine hydrolase [Burkholderiales bacterium RIFCSPHIGHO2_02_FULL_64_19]OGB18675.1 MAG: serine hydrolase [Burkholderiales bacterium RIFCSPHIGHO2_12_FULL_65_48]OGB59572.1 MAG: serine hydrolase [Burkholderiales bacterium RIFCSPLOWO2_12_FULL_64_33]